MRARPDFRVTVASPCSKSWEQMKGTAQKRFCEGCQQHVYDLSAMRFDEARDVLALAIPPCVRFFRRADGTVMTADCPVGRQRARRKLQRLVSVAAAALVAATAMVRGWFSVGATEECEVSPLIPLAGLAAAPPPEVEPAKPADDSWMAQRRALLSPRERATLMMGRRHTVIQIIRGDAQEKKPGAL
jgi:hypothetical protein